MAQTEQPNFNATTATEVIRRHNIAIHGEGEQTLVFGHGFGCDQDIWQHVTPAFYAQYRVVLFDYIGCGKSDLGAYNKKRYNHLQAYADDLLQLCQSLQLNNIIFVGHSVSGAIALLASIKQPTLFKKIIAIGPSPRYLNDPPAYFGGFEASDIAGMLAMMELNYFEWSNYLAPKVIGQTDDAKSVDELKLSFMRSDPVISLQFANVTFYCDIRPQLPAVSVPVTILYCLEDIIVPVQVIEYLQQHIPNAKIMELAASGHYPQLINPGAVIAAIRKEISSEC
ncbi:MAG: alpha/beta hydrolase [Alishewanella sp.]|uniref:alpha/beta fold hydrolase n=1 Tax=Alishewanella sp. HL-SH05 TaxID=3461145 RepID=UPI0027796EBA|nr:alpha/beta hydrolase [Alishewanella sp.]MDP5185922.1 alpha/beta hydrolase [Alishewanella sp.]